MTPPANTRLAHPKGCGFGSRVCTGAGSAGAAVMALAIVAMTALPVAAAGAGDNASVKAVDEIAAAERSFSGMSVEKNMRDAFVEFLADDGIIFRPLAVVGKPIWQARTPTKATLIWEPGIAEASAAGDLGWDTGPWEFRPPADSTGAPPPADQIGHGYFTSVWAKQPNGRWRVAFDCGTSNAKPEHGGLGEVKFEAKPEHAWAKGLKKTARARANLVAIERLYARDAKQQGAAALDTWGTSDLRFNREGDYPAQGRDAAKAATHAAADLVRFVPSGSRVSESDDLGYTFGVVERMAARSEAPDSSVYLHVWRKEADHRWRMAAIVENPLKK